MRRAWKWVMGLVGITAASVGLLAFDVHQRALRAIEAEESRLRDDLAAFRARRPGAARPERGFEAGHSGRRQFPPVEKLPPELLLSELDRTERDSFECGYDANDWRRFQDMTTLSELRNALLRRRLRRSELQQFSVTLQQLLSRRPAVAEIIEAEHLLDRAELLNILRDRHNGQFLVDGPGWREFFSWRILIVKALRELEERKKQLLSLKSDSLPDWETAALEFGLRIRHEPAYTRSRLCSQATSLLEGERQSLLSWRFTQIAVRISLFLAENDRLPADLKDLGLEVPVSPYDGKPFEYRDGTLKTSSTSLGPSLEWVSSRR
jgi:hypothetical protein